MTTAKRRLTGPQAAARVADLTGRPLAAKTWSAYVARGQAPAPDGRCDPCECPWWWQSTVDRYVEQRPGVPGRPAKAQTHSQ